MPDNFAPKRNEGGTAELAAPSAFAPKLRLDRTAVGSGELLAANKLNRMKRLMLAFGPDHPIAIGCIHCNDLKIPVAHPLDIQRGIVHATEPYVINLIGIFFDS